MTGSNAASGIADAERAALCDLLIDVGPDAPTLCGGWTTRDLAAHLLLRETRPDAAAGILLPPLSGYTAKVQRGIAGQPYPETVDAVRSGPPRWSPYRLPMVNEATNTVEFFVHHEDVRRARAGWQPRPGDARLERRLWRALGPLARLSYRRSPVGVVLRRPDGEQQQVKAGPRGVTLTGPAGELVLHAFGRDEVRLDTAGAPEDVAAVQRLPRGF